MIEILVVVIIIPIITGIAISNFNKQTQEVILEKQAEAIIDALELTKRKSLATDLGLYAGACPNFGGYRITFTPASPYTGYSMNICCGGVCNSGVATYTIKTGLTVTISGPNPIQFKALDPGTTAAVNTVITVRNPVSISKCISITITPLGIISRGPKVSC